jgi:hypothetical protein
MVYKWKDGVCFKADAGKCKAEIDTLSEKNRENVVGLARNRRTELHKCFEWNDAEAAEKYRLDQAGEVLRSIVLVSVIHNEEVSIRTYEREGCEHNSPYRNVSESLSDETFKQTIINRVKRDIESMVNVANSYQRFFNNPKEFKKAVQAAAKYI